MPPVISHRSDAGSSNPVHQTGPAGTLKELFTGHPFLPSQIRDVWHHSRAVAPERVLGMAVLARAVVDLELCGPSSFRRGERLYRQAYEWVSSEDRSWPFSFLNLCDMLQLSPSAIRARWLRLGSVQGRPTYSRRGAQPRTSMQHVNIEDSA